MLGTGRVLKFLSVGIEKFLLVPFINNTGIVFRKKSLSLSKYKILLCFPKKKLFLEKAPGHGILNNTELCRILIILVRIVFFCSENRNLHDTGS